VKAPGGSSEFRKIRLFYARAKATSYVKVSYDGGEYRRFSLRQGPGLQMLDLSPSGPVARIRLEFDPLDPIHVYGVSFDDANGVYVDNLSVRGYSGMYFQRIPADLLRGFQRELGYDLIILQYGENVSSPDVRDYGFYRKGMIRTVQHIRAALGEVPVLIISAHDRSIKRNGAYQTSMDIPILVSAQGEVARETDSAFWNLFEAMGGLNSMQDFVKAKPPLANLDYTHFTLAGANKIALMLYEVLTTGKTD
jgi:lysophospholipase L1-like esterase